MRLYLAGPMSGYYRHNFDSFACAARLLRTLGYEVVSPAEEAIRCGFDPDASAPLTPDEYEAAMARDFALIDGCETVCLLHGWIDSNGARREVEYAIAHGKGVVTFGAMVGIERGKA